MDIFNHHRIAELEKKLHETELDRDRYMSKAAELAVKLDEVSKLEESIPEGCVKGPWCKACEFSKTIHYSEHYGYNSYSSLVTMYVCSKGKSCENFVQKEIKDD
jgi:hypothetical protein